jgi:quercetin dioxygenase-like cupin family protein
MTPVARRSERADKRKIVQSSPGRKALCRPRKEDVMTTPFNHVDFDDPARTGGFEPHPAFKGVRLRHVVVGAGTHGGFSSHVVQVGPGCALHAHRHPDQDEQHVVLRGGGRLTLDGEARDYAPGTIAVMPRGHEHEVVAGPDGLLLLATFAPPLR